MSFASPKRLPPVETYLLQLIVELKELAAILNGQSTKTPAEQQQLKAALLDKFVLLQRFCESRRLGEPSVIRQLSFSAFPWVGEALGLEEPKADKPGDRLPATIKWDQVLLPFCVSQLQSRQMGMAFNDDKMDAPEYLQEQIALVLGSLITDSNVIWLETLKNKARFADKHRPLPEPGKKPLTALDQAFVILIQELLVKLDKASSPRAVMIAITTMLNKFSSQQDATRAEATRKRIDVRVALQFGFEAELKMLQDSVQATLGATKRTAAESAKHADRLSADRTGGIFFSKSKDMTEEQRAELLQIKGRLSAIVEGAIPAKRPAVPPPPRPGTGGKTAGTVYDPATAQLTPTGKPRSGKKA